MVTSTVLNENVNDDKLPESNNAVKLLDIIKKVSQQSRQEIYYIMQHGTKYQEQLFLKLRYWLPKWTKIGFLHTPFVSLTERSAVVRNSSHRNSSHLFFFSDRNPNTGLVGSSIITFYNVASSCLYFISIILRHCTVCIFMKQYHTSTGLFYTECLLYINTAKRFNKDN